MVLDIYLCIFIYLDIYLYIFIYLDIYLYNMSIFKFIPVTDRAANAECFPKSE